VGGGEGLLEAAVHSRERGGHQQQQADGPQDVQVLFLFGRRLAPAPGEYRISLVMLWGRWPLCGLCGKLEFGVVRDKTQPFLHRRRQSQGFSVGSTRRRPPPPPTTPVFRLLRASCCSAQCCSRTLDAGKWWITGTLPVSPRNVRCLVLYRLQICARLHGQQSNPRIFGR
jgi:hypothetical protein